MRILKAALILMAIAFGVAHAGIIANPDRATYFGNGIIRGVISGQSGLRLPHAKIIFLTILDEAIDSVYTGDDGGFLLNLSPGSYKLSAECEHYSKKYYPNAYDLGEANHISLYPKQELFVSMVLDLGGSLSGNITTNTSEPASVIVSAIKIDYPYANWESDRIINVTGQGSYSMTGLLPGYYKVFVRGLGFQTQYYSQVQTMAEASLVRVNEVENTGGINFAIIRPGNGVICGQATNINTGLPLSGILICAYQWRSLVGDPNRVFAVADAAGQYRLELTSGYYNVAVMAGDAQLDFNNFLVYYNGRFCNELADEVHVGPLQVIDNINFALDPLAEHDFQISGSLTSHLNGEAVAGAKILALEYQTGIPVSLGTTKMDGGFTVDNLCAGTYILELGGTGIVPSYWPDALSWQDAQQVVLSRNSFEVYNGGAITQDYGTPGLSIAGHVGGSNGPLSNVRVYAVNIGNDMIAFTKTDETGNYEISSGLSEGAYSVMADLYFYNNAVYPGIVALDLVQSPRVEGIDFLLARATQGIKTEEQIPKTTTLLGNYPNPFNSGTMISFMAQTSYQSEIRIYDVIGRLNRTIMISTRPGLNSIYWDGRNDQGQVMATGVYFYLIKDFSQTRKMLLIK